MIKLFIAKQRIKRLGVDNMPTLADRLKALDKVLALFNIHVGGRAFSYRFIKWICKRTTYRILLYE